MDAFARARVESVSIDRRLLLGAAAPTPSRRRAWWRETGEAVFWSRVASDGAHDGSGTGGACGGTVGRVSRAPTGSLLTRALAGALSAAAPVD
jgi:hypothetical protein